jgi:transketolase
MTDTAVAVETDWVAQVKRRAHRVRQRAAKVVAQNNGGYFIQANGSAEIMTTLFSRLMDLGPSTGPMVPSAFDGVPTGKDDLIGDVYLGDRDRFYLSPAHYALGLYATLVEVGRLGEDVLDEANADGSTLELIGAEHSPGFSSTTGSLSQALSVAIGQALARQRYNRPGHVWAFISDGELEEGQTWEALASASNFGLENLTVLLDANGLQVDGWVKDVMNIEPIPQKVAAFGWTAIEVDGHDPEAIATAATSREPGKPLMVICRTDPAHMVPSLHGRHQLHYIRFRDGEAQAMSSDLGAMEESKA